MAILQDLGIMAEFKLDSAFDRLAILHKFIVLLVHSKDDEKKNMVAYNWV